ncbi:MAG: hypothetical protein KA142_01325 [Chromatiaceae bacterium]|nr:hypothetical protein [Chromatiaceae bacterium]
MAWRWHGKGLGLFSWSVSGKRGGEVLEYVKRIIENNNNIHKPDGRPNVLLFSTPRSGSTWLMELILTQSGFKPCDEPFDLRQRHVHLPLAKAGVTDWPHLYDTEHAGALEDYLKGTCDGRLHLTDRFFYRNHFRIITRRVVFKILHAGEDRINRWRDVCNGRVAYLVRHPLPVSLSRKSLPRLETFLNSEYRSHFDASQLRLARRIADTGNDLERGVLDWCLQNAVPFKQRTPDWTVVTYEQLVIDPLPLIDHLAESLGLEKSVRMRRRLAIASASTRQSDTLTRNTLTHRNEGQPSQGNAWLVEKWRARISEDEERRAMDILPAFGLEIYRAGSALPHHNAWIGSSAVNPLTPPVGAGR